MPISKEGKARPSKIGDPAIHRAKKGCQTRGVPGQGIGFRIQGVRVQAFGGACKGSEVCIRNFSKVIQGHTRSLDHGSHTLL